MNGYECSCYPGWTGTSCEVDIDECVGGLCENESACVDGVNGYTCSCLPGFAGTYCETNIDDCAGDPCLNGGACTDGVAGYTCACATGYSGDNCEVDIDDCAEAPCLNGGACVDGVDGYTCECTAGHEGTNCETPVGEAACPCSEMPFWIYALEQTPTDCIDSFGYLQADIYYAGGPYDLAAIYAGGTVCGWEHFPHVAEGVMTISTEESAACTAVIESWANANSVECVVY